MRSRSHSWQYRSISLDCWISGDSASDKKAFRSHDRTVPRSGSSIRSAMIVETSRSTVLATSSSFEIKAFVSKCGASVVVSVFLAREVSIFHRPAS